MKLSIITVVFNNVGFIKNTIKSVLSQTYKEVEYIIIDGGSTDGTTDLIKSYKDKISHFISEPDQGIYHAMNKGLRVATGEIIGFLNSDDIYASDNTLKNIIEVFKIQKISACYGDLVYVSLKDPGKIIRYWKAGKYKKGMFNRGWMPPHPTLFIRSNIYKEFGFYDQRFRISGDYELMLRFIANNNISLYYIDKIITKMGWGGKSNRTVKNLIIKSLEDYRALRKNRVSPAFLILILKPIRKIGQFIFKN